MRTAIFFASMNITTMLSRIANMHGGVEPYPSYYPTMYSVILGVFIVMDIYDFARKNFRT